MTSVVIGNILQVVETNSGDLKIDLRTNHGITFNEEDGRIQGVYPRDKIPKVDQIYDYSSCYLLPGFIDTHVHFPQLDIIGVYSGELLEWLNEHTFPHEIGIIKDLSVAKDAASTFSRQLYRNGTSTSVVFASSKKEPTDLLFEEFSRTGGRLITGKISMDRNAPEDILDPIENDLEASKALIEKWHGFDDRIFYAISPRFAPSCTDPLMQGLGDLHQDYPKTYVQTHFSENLDEIAWVKSLYPKAQDYLAVYEGFGLVNDRAILAHSVYATESELQRIRSKKTLLSHCPTSNLYLGSGLFSYKAAQELGINLSLGTDVGAGTSFSMWKTMAEAIKVSKLRREQVLPEQLFFGATLGAARGLHLDRIGSISKGMQMDVQVIDPSRSELLSRRLPYCEDERQLLSAFIFHCDDRNLRDLFIAGSSIDL